MDSCSSTEIDIPRGRGWRADLQVRFADRDGRTVVRERRHQGPLQVQRAFYPEGDDLCHLYVLHPPGGLVGGDTLGVALRADPGARALVTTPAAGKVYRHRDTVAGEGARQHVHLTVAAGASLEWLPQETIVFDGARVALETRVDVDGAGAFLGWEVLCLGRPAAGERFTRGLCTQRFELWRGDHPLCVERASLPGGGRALEAAWGLRGAPVCGTLLATPAAPLAGGLAELRAAAADAGELAAVTIAGEVLICRYLGGSAERARAFFTRVWALVRPSLLGRRATAPRIWST